MGSNGIGGVFRGGLWFDEHKVSPLGNALWPLALAILSHDSVQAHSYLVSSLHHAGITSAGFSAVGACVHFSSVPSTVILWPTVRQTTRLQSMDRRQGLKAMLLLVLLLVCGSRPSEGQNLPPHERCLSCCVANNLSCIMSFSFKCSRNAVFQQVALGQRLLRSNAAC